MTLTPSQFAARWRRISLSERSAAQSHFLDLCEVLGEPHPAASDATGEHFTFEKHVNRSSGGKGFADVWRKDHFAWEYKGGHKNLAEAYKQLNDYREDLGNPPLLVVCDLNRFEVHTNFDRTCKRVYRFNLNDVIAGTATQECPLPPLEVLRCLFSEPDNLRPEATAARVTEDAAEKFSRLAESIELQGADPRRDLDSHRVAHFLMRLLFCLFADSVGLLPKHMFREMIENDRGRPQAFQRKLRSLFRAMSGRGNSFGPYDIHFFNGGLFDDDEVLDLNAADLSILHSASRLDWSAVEPSIFGTLFERSLNAQKRTQIGAHYTSPADIALIVDPVVIAPLRRQWDEVQAIVKELAIEAATVPKGIAHSRIRRKMQEIVVGWMGKLAEVRILDPACGSGNFLYVALRSLLNLWWEASVLAAEYDLATILPLRVSPRQLYGVEVDYYAHELASIVVWIGYLQWRHERGMGEPAEPILEKLDNIQNRDAILDYDAGGRPREPEWPEADFIVSNPPFLGGKRLRAGLKDKYVDDLFRVYEGRVAPEADLVVYWFEKARAALADGKVRRVGLLATQAIRGGANRHVLDRVKESAHIFMAWSDRPWILDGAAVRISMVGFEEPGDREAQAVLDGETVREINPDLTSGADTTAAAVLPENAGVCFMGTTKVGAFDLPPDVARKILSAPINPNRRPNSDVIRPWVNAMDVTRRPRGMFIIDFGTGLSEREAALYEMPFQYLKAKVYPQRRNNKRQGYREKWWIHGEPRPDMRAALTPLKRYITTPSVSKHRLFAWLQAEVLPDHAVFVFARDDDYFFGVLHSCVHEVWARQTGTQLREVESGFRYTPTSTFETFPLPWPPGKEPKGDPRVEAIAAAARDLVHLRDNWLNPPGATEEELKKRTLTNLYNERPTWLEQAHARLDGAVFAAYGWQSSEDQDEILRRLLLLNHERAATLAVGSGKLPPKKLPGVERPVKDHFLKSVAQ